MWQSNTEPGGPAQNERTSLWCFLVAWRANRPSPSPSSQLEARKLQAPTCARQLACTVAQGGGVLIQANQRKIRGHGCGEFLPLHGRTARLLRPLLSDHSPKFCRRHPRGTFSNTFLLLKSNPMSRRLKSCGVCLSMSELACWLIFPAIAPHWRLSRDVMSTNFEVLPVRSSETRCHQAPGARTAVVEAPSSRGLAPLHTEH